MHIPPAPLPSGTRHQGPQLRCKSGGDRIMLLNAVHCRTERLTMRSISVSAVVDPVAGATTVWGCDTVPRMYLGEQCWALLDLQQFFCCCR